MDNQELNKNEFEDVLVDVRKSYRLLYLFQKRILDLVKFMGNSYYGFDFQGAYPRFSYTVHGRGRGNLDSWAWDWLTMYLYDFRFRCDINEKESYLTIMIQNDTGFFDANQENTLVDRLDIDDYKDTNESKSFIHFMLFYDTTVKYDTKFSEYNHMLQAGSPSQFVEKGFHDKENKKGQLIAMKFPISSFINETLTRQCLNEFNQFCSDNGYPLKKIDESNQPIT